MGERELRRAEGRGNDLFRELDIDLCREFGGVSAEDSLDLSTQKGNVRRFVGASTYQGNSIPEGWK